MYSFLNQMVVFAESGGSSSAVNQFLSFLPFIVILAVFYFVLILPQKKKEKELRTLLSTLKLGDEVLTIGGIRGKIHKLKDDVLLLETGSGADKSIIKIDRSFVTKLVKKAKDKTVVQKVETT